MPIGMTDLLKNQSEQLKNDLNTIGAELNAFKIQLEQENHEKKEKSDGNREVSGNFAELEKKANLLLQQVEKQAEVTEIQNIKELEAEIKEGLQLVKKKLGTQYSQLGNSQTSYSFENAVSTEFADEGRKESSDKIPQLGKKASKDKSRFIRKIIAPLINFFSS